MKISKKDALTWFRFFAMLPEEEELLPFQKEIELSVLAQIERAAEARFCEALGRIKGLKSLQGRTFYTGPSEKFARGCVSCLTGSGLGAVRRSNRCDAACPFCYDYGCLDSQPPIGDGYWEIGGTRFRTEDIELLLDVQPKPSGVAYVYLEPFTEIELYYDAVRVFHRAGVYQHLYTNGISATEEQLRSLGEAGLDEIRFNAGASGTSDRVIRNIALAKKYIPMAGIETPATPQFHKALLEKKDSILATGLDFINCAELHLNPNNLPNYMGEPLYMSRFGYVSPVWSRELSLDILRIASEERWDAAVHDCSNRTKFARDLNAKAREGGWFGSSSWHCEFGRTPYEAFLPILEDERYPFAEEEPLPEGYRPGDLTFL